MRLKRELTLLNLRSTSYVLRAVILAPRSVYAQHSYIKVYIYVRIMEMNWYYLAVTTILLINYNHEPLVQHFSRALAIFYVLFAGWIIWGSINYKTQTTQRVEKTQTNMSHFTYWIFLSLFFFPERTWCRVMFAQKSFIFEASLSCVTVPP